MRRLTYKGYMLGVFFSIVLLLLLSLSTLHYFRMPGALHYGHETLLCHECHQQAKGSFRQQIQANLRYFLGWRSTSVAFNFVVPDNRDCLACHEREDDHHPVYRFNEPRFSQARKAIQPQQCQSCHQQHKEVMFTAEVQNCRYCHQEMQLKDDPLVMSDVASHTDLIEQKQWPSCLACHDFHGNHVMKVPVNEKMMIDAKALNRYLAGKANSDPYATKKITPAKETRYDKKEK